MSSVSSLNLLNMKLILFTCYLLYPKLHPLYFPIYMLLKYSQIKVSKIVYKIKTVPDKYVLKIFKLASNTEFPIYDINNTILMNDKQLQILGVENFARIILNSDKQVKVRIVKVVPDNIPFNTVFVCDTLMHNLKRHGFTDKINLLPYVTSNIKVASAVDLSLINIPQDISNTVVDSLLKSYFQTPKILYKNDIISISIKTYGLDMYFTNIKMNNIQAIYFKCNKIECDTILDCNGGYFCAFNETTVTQSANTQGSIVPMPNELLNDNSLITKCPNGLTTYFNELKKAIKPFLAAKCKELKLKPNFLLQGSNGSGKDVIVTAVAADCGLHLYKISNCDISGSVYAQTETRLRNVFFKAKLSTPCMLVLKNFENFGKNNEGQYDQRIINFFKNELENLFVNNNFPIILICLSNNKDISVDLKRTFLEVFDLNAPSQNERTTLLSWILKRYDLKFNINLESIASKTHGFLYEDLEALVYYTKNNFISANEQSKQIVLGESDFLKALDLMQSNYRESLGAPKVPQVQWSDVGGLNDVKEEIIKSINLPLQHPEFLQKCGLRRSGILLYGPPGTGKTLIAKAVATECSLCFLSVKGPELLNSYVGQSEQNVREVFEKARQASPCIIFFDELDSLAPNRGITGDSGGVMDRIVSQLLAEIDGLNESGPIFVIGATNRPDLIDPALLRPGRFDKLLYVGPCTDEESKLSVITALTRKFHFSTDVNLKEVINICPKNITGADFYGICSAAWMSAARKLIQDNENGKINNADILTPENVFVAMDDFIYAIKDVKPSVNAEDLRYFMKLKSELSTNM